MISIDALITADIQRLKELPNLGEIMKKASWVEDIFCIYPTLTYPCHATITTGCWPDRHGIINNEKFQPLAENRADWFWFRDAIKVPTVIDYAKAQGLTTATVTWPVMGASGADYNIGEIWAPKEEDDPTPWFDQANSPEAKQIFEKNKHMLRWMKTPQMDEFAAQCAADIVRDYNPDLLLLHLSYVDHQRHRLGVHSQELTKAFQFVDEQIGKVLEAVEETNGIHNTNIVLLGDHGQLYCDELFHINSLFRKRGWLTQEKGVVKSWKVYAAQCSFSAQIYLQPEMDKQEVYRELKEIQKEYPQYIERIFTKEEAASMHLTGEFDFVVEAADRVAFDKVADAENLTIPVQDVTEYKASVSTHGHLPEKGDKPPFIMCGPNVVENRIIKGGNLIDEAPTILRLLGVEVKKMDGKAFELVKYENNEK